jgi:hypothetical protein
VGFHCVFCLTKGAIYFQDFCLILFLRFSKSLFNSSYIFCVVFFYSYMSFIFIVPFVSLWCLLKSSLSSFVSMTSHALYFWCLEISWVHLILSGLPCLVSSPWISQWFLPWFPLWGIFFVDITGLISDIYFCFVGVRNQVSIFFISHQILYWIILLQNVVSNLILLPIAPFGAVQLRSW